MWRTGWRCGPLGFRSGPRDGAWKGVWRTALTSSKGLYEAVDEPVEIGIPLPEGVDLAEGVNDRGVVFPTKALADLRKGRAGERLRQVHGDLAGDGHGLGVVLGLEIRELDVVVVGHELLDHLDRDRLVFGVQEVAEDLVGEGEVDVASGETGVGDEADEAALQLADVGPNLTGDEESHVLGDHDALGIGLLPKDGDLRFDVGRLDVGDEAP